ncbi:uncharacterized protein ELE39_002017 [Cryptosporidium sp. chipmunk genotype I]|uniref:uncharacterized protein n=1 Tax=Cryptosporidium sp. chipmunk genotype I TaxID=1280935 RepID=UPI00351A7DAA|nr:hypothetical protein ELE39_002017 [Cryptosporidium sp. chipmunk genotype I]
MYKEQFQILEDLLKNSQTQQIWSIYSLCNHSSKFENFEVCRDILKLFVKYLSEEKRDLGEAELVYLVMGDISLDEVTYKLVYHSDLSLNELEVCKSNIYGLVSKSSEKLQDKNNLKLNSLQFQIECDDIYKSIKAKNLLSDKLWISKFSNIGNTESYLLNESCNANFNSTSLEQSETKSKTEPYPLLFSNNKGDYQNAKTYINKNEDEQDRKKENVHFLQNENNTDPYPMKNIFNTEKKVILPELGSKRESDSVNNNVINLFKDEENESTNSIDEFTKNGDSKSKPTKRRKTSKSKVCSDKQDNEKKMDFDPLEVGPIIHSKLKKEKIYKDDRTGYLIVEDDVDFVMEKENKISKLREKVSEDSNVTSKRSNKVKKSQTFNINSGTSKQQTLNSFFKITKPTSKNT